MAQTTHWLPNLSAARESSVLSRTAAELTEILSAPASSSVRKSSTEEMPPPTVSGMNSSRAARSTSDAKVLRFSCEAVMSRNTISSAPSSL